MSRAPFGVLVLLAAQIANAAVVRTTPPVDAGHWLRLTVDASAFAPWNYFAIEGKEAADVWISSINGTLPITLSIYPTLPRAFLMIGPEWNGGVEQLFAQVTADVRPYTPPPGFFHGGVERRVVYTSSSGTREAWEFALASIPEPGGLTLAIVGLLAMSVRRRRSIG